MHCVVYESARIVAMSSDWRTLRLLITLVNVNTLQGGSLSLHIQLMIDIIVNAHFRINFLSSFTGVASELVRGVNVNHFEMLSFLWILDALMVVSHHIG